MKSSLAKNTSVNTGDIGSLVNAPGKSRFNLMYLYQTGNTKNITQKSINASIGGTKELVSQHGMNLSVLVLIIKGSMDGKNCIVTRTRGNIGETK